MSRCKFLFFFFSSRRRHTRFDCDWSSDVCSSDLIEGDQTAVGEPHVHAPVADRQAAGVAEERAGHDRVVDRKSTRLNSSHSQISYAVFCLKKKKPPV